MPLFVTGDAATYVAVLVMHGARRREKWLWETREGRARTPTFVQCVMALSRMRYGPVT